jgi:ParB family chromosome partitioning protein
MTDTLAASHVINIPTNAISVINPRERNKRSFSELVQSIGALGLKKPITVRRLDTTNEQYELICGQGRLEAFLELKQSEIPAIVVDVSDSDALMMSLIENMARRKRSPIEMLRDIELLKSRGYSIAEIGTKTGFSTEYVTSILILLEHGEDRLISSVERGIIPHSVAIEIARAKDADLQSVLAELYERKELPGNQILAIRRIVAARQTIGRVLRSGTRVSSQKREMASIVVRAYTRETEKQKLLLKKVSLAQNRLLFIVSSLSRLMAIAEFRQLLSSERLNAMPAVLADRIKLEAIP